MHAFVHAPRKMRRARWRKQAQVCWRTVVSAYCVLVHVRMHACQPSHQGTRHESVSLHACIHARMHAQVPIILCATCATRIEPTLQESTGQRRAAGGEERVHACRGPRKPDKSRRSCRRAHEDVYNHAGVPACAHACVHSCQKCVGRGVCKSVWAEVCATEHAQVWLWCVVRVCVQITQNLCRQGRPW